jgi:hypothetical protein
MAIWYICGHLAYFLRFWYVVPGKIWQPWLGTEPMPTAIVETVFLLFFCQKNAEKNGFASPPFFQRQIIARN